MDRPPGRNGDTAGSVRTRGGYDAYFAQPEPEESTVGTWRETVSRRSYREPPRPEVAPVGPVPPQPDTSDPNPVVVDVAALDAHVPATGFPFHTGHATDVPAAVEPLHGPVHPSEPGDPPPSANGSAPSTAPVSAARQTNPGHDHYTAPTAATFPPPGGFSVPPAPVRPPQTPAAAWMPEPITGANTGRALPLSIGLTSADLLADIAASRQAQLRSSTGVRGALNKVGFNIGLSPGELRTEDRHGRIRRHLTAPYQIAVLNVKGGVGRTTTVAALGSTFAALRPDRVAAIDANPDFGDLAGRTARHPYGLNLRDLARETHLDAFSAVQSFAAITSADLAVVASPWSPAAQAALSGTEYLAATATLRKHYNLMVVDCGTGVLDSATAAVLGSSNAVVVVTPASVRGVTGAVATLEWLSAHGLHRLATSSVIAIVHQHPAKPIVEVGRIEELFATAQCPTFAIPYDEHLAEGGEIDLRLVDKDTGLAFEELAAALADGFPDTLAATYDHTRGGWQ
ncbi:AAA family ATPase [Nocardia tengchongensis]|uniref:AAA family ATPase n=1 Tax=Nocardia tengchongensis TaxID=2055889 RepID=UPI0036B2B4CB